MTKETEYEVCELYKQNKITIRYIAKKYNTNVKKIRNILIKNNIKIKSYSEIFKLDENERKQIITLYRDKEMTLSKISKELKIDQDKIRKVLVENSIPIKSPQEFISTKLTKDDENSIIDDYINKLIPMHLITTKYKIRQKRFYKILSSYGYKMRKSNDTRMIDFPKEKLDEAINIYNSTGSLGMVSNFLKHDICVVKRILKENGVEIIKYNPSGVTLYDKWAILYGEVVAAKMYDDYLKLQSKNTSGKNNPMYGKPVPKGSGQGWKGYYKNFYFRSLRELSYLIYLDENNIRWETAERKKFTIKYKNYDNTDRTYRPDFLVNDNILVEIKPKRLQQSPLIKLKTAAAIKFCEKNDLKFEIIDFPIDALKIKEYLDKNIIKFDRDYKNKFLNYIKPRLTS